MRRRLDELLDPVGWLFWIVLGTAPFVWGYEKFVHWKPVCMCHPHSRPFAASTSPEAYRTYALAVPFHAARLRRLIGQNAHLVREFQRGRYLDHGEDFERDTKAIRDGLLESIERFDGRPVPDRMEKSHALLASSHRLCYESIQALCQASEEKGAERRRLLREAERKMRDARTLQDFGLKLHQSIWARTS